MSQILFFALFFAIYAIYIGIAFVTSKSSKSVDDYFLAGRNLTLFQTIVSLVATQLGGGFILGISQDSYKFGYYGLLYAIGICLGFLMLGFGAAFKLRAFKIETISQIFENYYGSSNLRKFSSIISILSLIGIFTAQIVGSKSLLLSLGVYNNILFIILWSIIIIYAMVGGLKAIVQNDIMQLCLIIIVFLTLFLCDFIFNFSQFFLIFESLFKDKIFVAEDINLKYLLPVAIIPALYSLIEQDLAQIFFACKSPKYAKIASFGSGIVLFLFALIPLYFGVKAKFLNINIEDSCNPLMSLFSQNYSSLITIFVSYGVLAAIISTANGILCAISSSIVKDFNLLDLKNNKSNIIISKLVMLFVGIIGLLAAFYLKDIIKVLVDSYAITISSTFVSILAVYIVASKQNNYKIMMPKLAAYLSFFSGLFSFIIFLTLDTSIFVNPEFDSFVLSLIFYILGYSIEKYYKY